ncbi:MAG: orotate phosphoribosyltransferase [Hyphomicrobiaceae bacterium]
MPAPDSRQRLIEIIRTLSVETGRTFTLASGRTSDFYCNLKPTMLDPEGAYLLGALIAEALRADRPDLVGGLELGAVPLATAAAAMSYAAREAGGHPMRAFVVRKQTKEHGTKSLVEGLKRGDSLKGRRVVILEDVTTTGGSSIKAIEAVRGEGAEVIKVLTMVDRQEGAAEAFAKAGIPFAALVTAAELR